MPQTARKALFHRGMAEDVKFLLTWTICRLSGGKCPVKGFYRILLHPIGRAIIIDPIFPLQGARPQFLYQHRCGIPAVFQADLVFFTALKAPPHIVRRITDSNLNHTGIYLYSKGKIMIHLTFDYQSDEGCTTPGQYLRYHRTFQGLTTRELAEKVGVVPATLVLYENDRHPIKHSTAVALANVLGIDRSRLLDEYTVFVDYPYSSLLKKVRRELSFTQMQMAEVIGIGQTTYSGWEREVRVPRRKEHEKILAAMKKLKVDVDTYLCQPNPL